MRAPWLMAVCLVTLGLAFGSGGVAHSQVQGRAVKVYCGCDGSIHNAGFDCQAYCCKGAWRGQAICGGTPASTPTKPDSTVPNIFSGFGDAVAAAIAADRAAKEAARAAAAEAAAAEAAARSRDSARLDRLRREMKDSTAGMAFKDIGPGSSASTALQTRARTQLNDLADAVSAPNLTAACQERAALVPELLDLRARRDLLRQILANRGFEHTTAELEADRQFSEDLDKRWPLLAARDELRKLLFVAAQKSLEDFIFGLQGLTTEQRGPFVRGLIRAAARLGPLGETLQRDIGELTVSADAQARLAAQRRIVAQLGRFQQMYDLARTEDQREQLWKGLMWAADEAATVIGRPVWGILVAECDVTVRLLFDDVRGHYTKSQIDELTARNEDDLKSLLDRTREMRDVGRRIGHIKERLSQLAACDSTQLVRR